MIYILVSCANAEEGKAIARALLEKRLIACATILPSVTSMYQWEGVLEESNECKVLLKTTDLHFEKIEQQVLSLSSYTTPEIAAWPASHVHVPYEKWLMNSLS